jgi:heat shock protein HslJ
MKRKIQVMLVFVLAIVLTACAEQLPTEEEPTTVPVAETSDEVAEPAAEEPAEEVVEPEVEEAIVAPADGVTEETAAAGSTENSLTGTIWNLTSLNGQSLVPTTSITAEFSEDGNLSGSSGCNNYTTTYESDGSNITINMSQAASTMMACPEPIMAQETAYMQALDQATTYEVNADTLTLFDAADEPVVIFSTVSQDLAGTSWEVISYNNGKEAVVSVIIDTQITAEFGGSGELLGSAGCNNYFGPYETDGENISMGPFGTTRKACQEPEGIMEQESQYLAALETADTYSIDGLNMNMRTADGATVANFRRILPEDTGTAAVEGEYALNPDQISLNTDALGTTWEAVVVPETPYDQSMPPGPVGMPEHIQILFGGTTDPNDVRPGDPVMYIIPVNPYRQMWDDAGNDSVTRIIQKIQELNFVLPSPSPTSGYPALPYEQVGTGVNDVAVQVGKAIAQNDLNMTSATQDGYRFVGRWVQDATMVSNYGPRYVYQGFTNDGVYLVSFWWPVTTEALPDSSELTDEQIEAFNADPAAAINSVAEQLNGLSTDQWEPDLAALDAVVASLQIEGMTAAGLVDKTWEWTEGPAQPGSSEIVTIEDPSLYQVTYGSDGNINYTADCNSGSMPYELSNAGMTGSMLASPGPMTLAACEPESLSDSFISSLQAAQSYQVWAGGNEMELVLPAGGGFLLLRDANAPDESAAESAAVSGMITNVDNAAIAEGATAAVQIQDTSLADAAATVMGGQIIENPEQFPIAYQVDYDPSAIVENHTYTMSTRITAADGSLLFINDTSIPVITRDNPTDGVEIPVIKVGG